MAVSTSAYGELSELGDLVASHHAYQGTDWTYIALIAVFTQERRSLFGYVLFANGHWEAKLPRDPQRSVMKAFRRLHTRMAADGRAWKQCLLEISRPEETITVDFEYRDPDRWSVTPARLEERVGAPSRREFGRPTDAWGL